MDTPGITTRVSVGDAELSCSVTGAGEPVLLIHGALVADAFAGLLATGMLDGYQVIVVHRRGYAGSSPAPASFDIAAQAADCRAALAALGIARAHVVGHSYGGTIALQLAAGAGSAVHSLALLEPALLSVPSAEAWFARVGAPAIAHYQAGDLPGAIDVFLRGVVGPEYQRVLDGLLGPDGWQDLMTDAPTFFATEFPALGAWQFGADEVRRIVQPVLAVLGAESPAVDPGYAERQDLLLSWFPRAEPYTLPGANHFLQMINPFDMASTLREFLARHPMPAEA